MVIPDIFLSIPITCYWIFGPQQETTVVVELNLLVKMWAPVVAVVAVLLAMTTADATAASNMTCTQTLMAYRNHRWDHRDVPPHPIPGQQLFFSHYFTVLLKKKSIFCDELGNLKKKNWVRQPVISTGCRTRFSLSQAQNSIYSINSILRIF